jgi:hypothetical protein
MRPKVDKSRSVEHVVSQLSPVHTLITYLKPILISSPYLQLDLPNGHFPSRSPTRNLYVSDVLPMATHLFFLDFILIIFEKEKRIRIFNHMNHVKP